MAGRGDSLHLSETLSLLSCIILILIMDSICVLTLNEKLDSLPLKKKLESMHNCSAEDISHLVTAVIPQDRLPLQYLESLSTDNRTVCYRTAMICWIVTGSSIVPREMQFRAVLVYFKKKDIEWWNVSNLI